MVMDFQHGQQSKTPAQPEDEANRYSRRSILRSERMYGEGFQSPGGLDAVKGFCRRLRMRQGMKILEVGSGLGGSAFYLAETFGADVLGLDVSAEMVAVSTERKEEKGLSNVSFRRGDIRTGDLEMGAFDLVWTRDCILYVPQKELVWSNIRAALKPGGQLFVIDFCLGSGPLSDEFENYVRECQYYLLALDEYVRMLERVGFVEVHMEDITPAFVKGLRQEQERLVNDREAFLREFDENDYGYLINRWDKKIRFCERDDLKWGLFVAMK
jgi:phosphoethanolamine N-methyltransferase